MSPRAAALGPALLVACCFAAGGIHVVRPSAEHVGLIHGYWMDHWLLGYEGGFVRRGLLGAVADAATLTSHAYLIHAAALSIVFGIATLIWRRLRAHFPAAVPAAMIVWIAVTLSPAGAVFWETLGDPLHVVLLATMAAIGLIPRLSPVLGVALAVIMLVPAIAIHEAAVFLAAPALAWQVLRLRDDGVPRPARILGAIVVGLLAAAITVGVITKGEITAEQRVSRLPEMRIATGDGEYRTAASSPLFQSFAELRSHLPRGAGETAGLAFRSLIVPGLLTAILAAAWGDGRHRAVRRSFLVSLVVLGLAASPLAYVARDWGRFAIYVWWLALMSATSAHVQVPPAATRASGRLVGLAVLLLAIAPLNPIYRAAGVTNRSALVFVVLAGAAWVYGRWAVQEKGKIPPPEGG